MIERCMDCRWWQGKRDEWSREDTGTCDRIHAGGGDREPLARIYPIGTSAWLETRRDFWCVLFESFGSYECMMKREHGPELAKK